MDLNKLLAQSFDFDFTVKTLFNEADLDKDGFLSNTEFQNLSKKIGLPYSDEIFRWYDRNNDNKISYNGLLKFETSKK